MIKAIETEYNGYRFRSRLEARWAVFFDAAGIEYQYEPEGFELEDGMKYLPDFYLPEVMDRRGSKGIWVEVKGEMTDQDLHKIEMFCDYRADDDHPYYYYPHRNPTVILGIIPREYDDPELMNQESEYTSFEYIDGDCYPLGFYKDKSSGKVYLRGFDSTDDPEGFEYFNTYYKKARQARFEHRESPE